MIHPPEIKGEIWFNSKPLIKADLEGKVVLYDFWTYSCVNCLRTIPHLKELWEKYKNEDFIIIGVHSPEFEFEKKEANVKMAIEKLGISWPVVLDNEHENWNAFANHYWPAKYIKDDNDEIVYSHFGEGAYSQTEMVIRYLLGKAGPEELKNAKEEQMGHVCTIATPELYLGYERGALNPPQEYMRDDLFNYICPEVVDKNNTALSGQFEAGDEYVETNQKGAEIILNFSGTEVNLVLEPLGLNSMIKIEFNGPVRKELAGKDLDIKTSTIKISDAKMYNILKSDSPMEGILKISCENGGFRAYAFTFSSCA